VTVVVPEAVVRAFLRASRANRPYVSAAGAEAAIRAQGRHPASYHPPRRLRSDVTVTLRHEGSTPVYTVTPTASAPVGHVVYVHGGGWIHEVSPQHWRLAAQIAAEANTTVTVPVYDLLPVGDAATAHDLVVRLVEATGDPGAVRLAGDSAGGQIALSAALTLRDRGHGGVRTVLIAPALDLSLSNPDVPRVLPSDPWLGIDGIRVLGERWAGDLPITDPRVSPLAGDLAGLGPMLLFSGTRDVLNPDARLLAAEARAAGVDVTFVERPGSIHVHPLLPTRQGAAARARIVAALRA
jgi:acetyl esterase/lipase